MWGYAMDIKVLKFGGTSLRNEATRKYVYKHVIKESMTHKVVLVVSAMGRYPDAYATDTLLSLGSDQLSKEEKARLVSMGEQLSAIKVCSELLDMGLQAHALPFFHCGIITDDHFEYAKVLKLDKQNIMKKLQTFDILVVCGFIGISTHSNITTLGRGGSDYSSVLFAEMLSLHEVDIYTDVDGIYDIDPKIADTAIKYDTLTYDDMLNMKSRVLHDRCVNYAKEKQIKIHLRGTFSSSEGTWVKD